MESACQRSKWPHLNAMPDGSCTIPCCVLPMLPKMCVVVIAVVPCSNWMHQMIIIMRPTAMCMHPIADLSVLCGTLTLPCLDKFWTFRVLQYQQLHCNMHLLVQSDFMYWNWVHQISANILHASGNSWYITTGVIMTTVWIWAIALG